MEWLLDTLIYTYIFIMGMFLGSFYNVVGIRLPKKETLLGRSHCPNCGHQLGALELFPVIGYLLIKGKCKSCKSKIALKYPMMEFLTGVLFLISYIYFGENIIEYSLILVFISLMTIVTVSDLYYQIVPDRILIIFLPIIVTLRILSGEMPWYEGVIGGILGFLFLFGIQKYAEKRFGQDALGGGDVKLYLLIGTFLGYQLVFLSLVIAALSGMIHSALRKQKEGTHIAFVPYIYFGSMIAYYFGRQFIELYLNLF